MKTTAAALVRHALEQIGVRYTFGIPGVHNIELYDELAASESITPVLVTHEGAGAFMADAISRSTGSIGVLAIVPAAGITHAMSGIGEAYLDGVPMLVISGGIRTDLRQKFQLHDVDQQALLRPLTKATYKLERHEDAIPMVYEAYRVATSGEPGPVFIELPANLQLFTGQVDTLPDFEDQSDRPAVDRGTIEAAAALLAQAERPGLFVGWGARHVQDDLVAIAEHLGAPAATTLQGLAVFPGDHPLHAGMTFGRSAVPASEHAFRDCDVMLAVGTRFAEIATGSYGAVPPANLVHIDINPDVIGANYPATVGIPADARDAVPALREALQKRVAARDRSATEQAIATDKAAYRDEWLAHNSGGRVNPCRFFTELRRQLDDDAIVVSDDGNHTFLTAELMTISKGGEFLSPTDFNCMGYCVPATIAARLAQPDRQVVGIVGDGAFLMTGLEAVTAVANGVGAVWFVFNDGELAQIAQAQSMPYQRTSCTDVGRLDFGAFAAATGCEYVGIQDDNGLGEGISTALRHSADGRPVIVDVRIDYSKKTRFTTGTVKTNLKRLDTPNKLRIVGRALKRRFLGSCSEARGNSAVARATRSAPVGVGRRRHGDLGSDRDEMRGERALAGSLRALPQQEQEQDDAVQAADRADSQVDERQPVIESQVQAGRHEQQSQQEPDHRQPLEDVVEQSHGESGYRCKPETLKTYPETTVTFVRPVTEPAIASQFDRHPRPGISAICAAG